MKAPVKLGLYVALLAATFGAAYFTAQVVVEADESDDWRPQIHETASPPGEQISPSSSAQPSGGEEHEGVDEHGEGES